MKAKRKETALERLLRLTEAEANWAWSTHCGLKEGAEAKEYWEGFARGLFSACGRIRRLMRKETAPMREWGGWVILRRGEFERFTMTDPTSVLSPAYEAVRVEIREVPRKEGR